MREVEPNRHRSVAQLTADPSYSVVFMAAQPLAGLRLTQGPPTTPTAGGLLGSRNPTDPKKTLRVLTVMLAEEC